MTKLRVRTCFIRAIKIFVGADVVDGTLRAVHTDVCVYTIKEHYVAAKTLSKRRHTQTQNKGCTCVYVNGNSANPLIIMPAALCHMCVEEYSREMQKKNETQC